MVDAASNRMTMDSAKRAADTASNTSSNSGGINTPSLPHAPSISARVSGADAVRIGGYAGPTAQQNLQWAQTQGPVQFVARALGITPSASGQLSQVQQERLAPIAAEANAITPPDSATLARLSNDVYNDSPQPPAGYRVATDADLASMGLKPSDLTSTQSAFRARVYVTGAGENQQYVVAFRGSTSDRSDWVTNARQAAGLSSDHYSRALTIGRALARNDDVPVTITGHSLGGGLASAAAIASGRDATTFNAAGLSQNTINQAQAINTANNPGAVAQVSAIYVRGEILSALQDGGDQAIGGWLGRAVGSWAAGPLGGVVGGEFGRTFADAPSAYGNRIAIDAVRPSNLSWYQDFPVLTSINRHGMDYVLSSMGIR